MRVDRAAGTVLRWAMPLERAGHDACDAVCRSSGDNVSGACDPDEARRAIAMRMRVSVNCSLRRVTAAVVVGAGLLILLVGSHSSPGQQAAQPAAAVGPRADAGERDAEERERKARLLAGSRWRRAMFELDEWLATQPVYTPAQVRRIKADLAARVAAMSSYEIEYLLESLTAKLTILESSRAREAREWLGRYLVVMSDRKRAALLADVPNVVDMSAGELAAALEAVEAKRRAVESMARQTARTRRDRAALDDAGRQSVAAIRAARARISIGDVSFSPYRCQPVASPPFADAYDSPTVVGAWPWLMTGGINVGGL